MFCMCVYFVCVYAYIICIESVGKDINATEIDKCMAICVNNIRLIATLLPRGG